MIFPAEANLARFSGLCLYIGLGPTKDHVLTTQERSILARRIISGKSIMEIVYNSNSYRVDLVDPTLFILSEADWVYNKSYKKLKEETDIMTLEESYELLIEQKQWNAELEKEFLEIQQDITTLHKQLNKAKFNKAVQKAIKKTIDKGQIRLQELFLIKNQLRNSTIEFMAERTKNRFIMSKIVQSIMEIDSGLNQSELIDNTNFIDTLIVYYFEESGIAESKIRELARTDPWRLFWTTAKDTGTSLFRHPSVEMTELQQNLVLWTRVYDFAYASLNRPTDDIIDDDEAFNAWYKSEYERIDNETRQSNLTDTFGSANEIFIPSDAEGAKEVYKLNDQMARLTIQSREKAILAKGEIKEQALPDVKARLQMEMNKMGMESVKNRS